MNKHTSNKIKENSNTVRHLIMGQIITTQNLVAIKEVRHAGQSTASLPEHQQHRRNQADTGHQQGPRSSSCPDMQSWENRTNTDPWDRCQLRQPEPPYPSMQSHQSLKQEHAMELLRMEVRHLREKCALENDMWGSRLQVMNLKIENMAEHLRNAIQCPQHLHGQPHPGLPGASPYQHARSWQQIPAHAVHQSPLPNQALVEYQRQALQHLIAAQAQHIAWKGRDHGSNPQQQNAVHSTSQRATQLQHQHRKPRHGRMSMGDNKSRPGHSCIASPQGQKTRYDSPHTGHMQQSACPNRMEQEEGRLCRTTPQQRPYQGENHDRGNMQPTAPRDKQMTLPRPRHVGDREQPQQQSRANGDSDKDAHRTSLNRNMHTGTGRSLSDSERDATGTSLYTKYPKPEHLKEQLNMLVPSEDIYISSPHGGARSRKLVPNTYAELSKNEERMMQSRLE